MGLFVAMAFCSQGVTAEAVDWCLNVVDSGLVCAGFGGLTCDLEKVVVLA